MIERSLIPIIKTLLNNFPCVVLVGARQVGKLTLLKQVLPEAAFYDLERSQDYQVISNDPEFFLTSNKTPLIIDEAQIYPELFNALRVVIDSERKQNGRYLLSGSSSPHLLKNISESLAGRVAIFEVPGFSWGEAYKQQESNFVDSLFDQESLLNLRTIFSNKQ